MPANAIRQRANANGRGLRAAKPLIPQLVSRLQLQLRYKNVALAVTTLSQRDQFTAQYGAHDHATRRVWGDGPLRVIAQLAPAHATNRMRGAVQLA
jgi:hypothetical protein